jgi:hypothetical protein
VVLDITSPHVDRLRELLGGRVDVLKGLQRSFSGEAAAGLKSFLEEHDIPHDAWSRIGD